MHARGREAVRVRGEAPRVDYRPQLRYCGLHPLQARPPPPANDPDSRAAQRVSKSSEPPARKRGGRHQGQGALRCLQIGPRVCGGRGRGAGGRRDGSALRLVQAFASEGVTEWERLACRTKPLPQKAVMEAPYV
ncbi:unnamed protein product [Laminaria digitata]